MGQIAAFLRSVSEGQPAPRGPDGGYLVPRYLYSHLLPHDTTEPDALPTYPPRERLIALAPLANARLRSGDEEAARDILIVMLDALVRKAPLAILRTQPLEIEASGEATYRTANGKLGSAFANDETVFRLSVRLPDAPSFAGTEQERAAGSARP